MNYCDCCCYCAWGHPGLCAPSELVPVWIFGHEQNEQTRINQMYQTQTNIIHMPSVTPKRPAHLIRVAVPRLNKNCTIAEYLVQLKTRDYDLEWAEVRETKVFTDCHEWNKFMNNLMNDRDWLAGRGGHRSWTVPDGNASIMSKSEIEHWRAGAYLLVVAAVAPTGQTIYIDPQGYDYARYVAFPASDGMPDGETRQERAKREANEAKATKLARIAHELENPPTVPDDHGLKFLWNGIKYNGGKLELCSYDKGNTYDYPDDTLIVRARDYNMFSAPIKAVFTIHNATDTQSDYFADDTAYVMRTHPLYPAIHAAWESYQAHNTKRHAKWQERYNNRHGVSA